VCGSASIIIWGLLVSSLDEKSLTSRLRLHGPKFSKIIIATRGLSKGRNQARDGSQDLIPPIFAQQLEYLFIVPLTI
jgi:hypothetical protein